MRLAPASRKTVATCDCAARADAIVGTPVLMYANAIPMSRSEHTTTMSSVTTMASTDACYQSTANCPRTRLSPWASLVAVLHAMLHSSFVLLALIYELAECLE